MGRSFGRAALAVFAWVFTVTLAFAEPNPDKAASAEVRRLSEEVLRHARENRPAGVEREYQRLLKLSMDVAGAIHVAAASAALERGDTLLAMARFQRAPDTELVANESYSLLRQRFALLKMSAKPGGEMVGPSLFVPDEAKAVTAATERLARTGTYYGMLPAGNYALPGGCEPQPELPCRADFAPGNYYSLAVP